MAVLKTFVKNYGYGSYIGILSHSDDSEYRKTSLNYYQVLANGTLKQISEAGKETRDLEKLARTFLNKQDVFILWTY